MSETSSESLTDFVIVK